MIVGQNVSIGVNYDSGTKASLPLLAWNAELFGEFISEKLPEEGIGEEWRLRTNHLGGGNVYNCRQDSLGYWSKTVNKGDLPGDVSPTVRRDNGRQGPRNAKRRAARRDPNPARMPMAAAAAPSVIVLIFISGLLS